MFHNARLKLTGWYLLMIMFISLVFSIVIYANVDRELVRFEKFQQLSNDRAQENFGYKPGNEIKDVVDQQLINEARERLISDLALLNTCILIAAGVAGYFLAGRTLTPIKKMLDDQSRFFGDASHELKTPITSMRSEIEIYLRSNKKTLADADAVIKSNLEEVGRIQDLTDDLLSLATLEKTGEEMKFSKLNLKNIIEFSVSSVNAQAINKTVQILNKVPNITINGNEKSLIQLFTILLDNAIKYSPKDSKVTIVATSSARICTIKVSDNGIGIPEEDLEHIFDRFYRADKSRGSTLISGYGLGLSIANEIVDLHGGDISAISSKKGSVFTVEIPVI